MLNSFIFSSESVCEGHPDKVCDAISDAVLDNCLAQDPSSRVACETLVKGNLVVLAGEISSRASLNLEQITRQTIRNIGYTHPGDLFHADKITIFNAISEQSPDIAQGVDLSNLSHKTILNSKTPVHLIKIPQTKEKRRGRSPASLAPNRIPSSSFAVSNLTQQSTAPLGAGDQGLVFGYACRDTEELMPLPIMLAHKLGRRLHFLRQTGQVKWLRPDGKTQVSVEYRNQKPVRVTVVVISVQHTEDISQNELRRFIFQQVIQHVIPSKLLNSDTEYFINPTGRFVLGGPEADTGLTGRKVIVDTYGGMGRHGGGCFSGKDPSKVDRSGAYMARYVAKNLVAAGLADRLEIQIAYAIGHPSPVSIGIETFATARIPETRLREAVEATFSFTPADMIAHLQLLRPIYSYTTHYGHFGYSSNLDLIPWEKTDRVGQLQNFLKKNSVLKNISTGKPSRSTAWVR